MPYILNKTNGTIVATVQDASLDQTTDLIFVGRNYAGYGEWQNENFLKLLENFANTTPPAKPLEGQVWYDAVNKRTNVWDGGDWKSIANLDIASDNPKDIKSYRIGDLWYSSTGEQLYAFNGTDFSLIGPPTGADIKAQWKGDLEYGVEDPGTPKYNIKSIIGANNDVIAVVSAETYTITQTSQSPYPSYPLFNADTTATISKGITLVGADYISGESAAAGVFFWGTAKHAEVADVARACTSFSIGSPAAPGIFPIPYTTSTSSVSETSIFSSPTFYYNSSDNSVNATFFKGVASSAYYADLAERYAADAVYAPGTVVIIGGTAEITVTSKRANTAIAGVISKDPAFKMNSEAGSDLTHPYVALKGRVPCNVVGPIKKGELLVTSQRDGYAEAFCQGDDANAVIGKALEHFEGLFGVIEIKV